MDETNRPTTPPPAHAPEKVAHAKAFCETLFQKLELPVTVEVRETPEAIGLSLVAGPGRKGRSARRCSRRSSTS